VVWVGAGKDRAIIDRFFSEAVIGHQRHQIRWVSCDMIRAYTEAIMHRNPNATLVIDHFYVTKALNEAVDVLTNERSRIAAGAQRKAINGLRELLYRHAARRTKARTRTLIRLRHSNRRIHRAWVLKDHYAIF
jgi:transposase